jgi:peptide/nickel transport system permease protein
LLLLPTLLLTYSIGLIWGMTAGWKRGSRFEYTSLVITLTGRAAPTFWVGMMVITLFSFKLGLFPSGGMTSPGYYFDSFYKMLFSPNVLWHMILPVTTYAFYLIGLPFLVMRTGMLENINKDYTIMHRYCGLSDTKVMTRAARNSLLPVITVIALGIGHIFEGSPVVEAVFGWPGIGLLLVDGVTSSDYPLAQACFLMLAASVLIMNFMADILYGLLDPRIKTERGL